MGDYIFVIMHPTLSKGPIQWRGGSSEKQSKEHAWSHLVVPECGGQVAAWVCGPPTGLQDG